MTWKVFFCNWVLKRGSWWNMSLPPFRVTQWRWLRSAGILVLHPSLRCFLLKTSSGNVAGTSTLWGSWVLVSIDLNGGSWCGLVHYFPGCCIQESMSTVSCTVRETYSLYNNVRCKNNSGALCLVLVASIHSPNQNNVLYDASSSALTVAGNCRIDLQLKHGQ